MRSLILSLYTLIHFLILMFLDCPAEQMDVVFLIDAFIGVNERAFFAIKKFIIDFVRSFEVGPHSSQFAVLQYSSRQRLVK